ncbi:hypothetical protein HY480_02755 [Candidatus Uhrbacteria bacterium]|nr:hypothetical protein [Candidatus Uhrbacteria bacterium]
MRRWATVALFMLMGSVVLLPQPALAQQCINNVPQEPCKSAQRYFITNPQCACCGNCQLSDFVGLAVEVSRFIFGISGSLALAMFIYGGYYWLTAAGIADRVDKGKKAMVAAVVGIIIIFGAWILVNTLLAVLTNNFTSPGAVVTGEWWKPK